MVLPMFCLQLIKHSQKGKYFWHEAILARTTTILNVREEAAVSLGVKKSFLKRTAKLNFWTNF